MTVITNSTCHLYADIVHIDMQFTGMANIVTEMNTLKPFTVELSNTFSNSTKTKLRLF